jgi:hypothetical protein
MHTVGMPNIHPSLVLVLLAITVLISGKSGHSMGEGLADALIEVLECPSPRHFDSGP